MINKRRVGIFLILFENKKCISLIFYNFILKISFKNAFLKKESKIFNYFAKADEKIINKKEENDEIIE